MIWEENQLTASSMADARSPERVERIVTYILESNGKNNPEKALSTAEIIKKYRSLRKSNREVVEIPETTLATQLSLLAGKPDCPITCPGRKQGYYVQVEGDGTDPGAMQNNLSPLLEKDLYPILCEWMGTYLEMSSVDISEKRGGQVWQNPDLLGVKNYAVLGEDRVEITTVEVKRDLEVLNEKWRQNIFEAVSHSLFSHKTYYAFLKPSRKYKVPHEMKIYASRFGIGIITIAIEDSEKSKIKTSEDLRQAVAEGNCKIVEEVPAPYHEPDISMQQNFFKGLKVFSKQGLMELVK